MYLATTMSSPSRLRVSSVRPERVVADLARDVREGLLGGPPRSLPPKYFYDAVGSELFDRICDTPEYYPTRTEDALLAACAGDVIARASPARILELGAGTARKTRRLLQACDEAGSHPVYLPFDVCYEVLAESGRGLIEDHPWLIVEALVGDYHAGLGSLPRGAGPTLFLFLGSTIGNFAPHEALAFLAELARQMGPADRLLLGADRVKDPALLHAAYNDAEGLTARFNLNVLEVLNARLGADFDPPAFDHHAIYHPPRQQIEMYLIARAPQRVTLRHLRAALELAEGEAILTEISRKFTPAGLEDLLREAGLAPVQRYDAPEGRFSLVLARTR